MWTYVHTYNKPKYAISIIHTTYVYVHIRAVYQHLPFQHVRPNVTYLSELVLNMEYTLPGLATI